MASPLFHEQSVVKDIPVNFQGGAGGKTVVTDFAFVTDTSRNILVLASSEDNNVVLVDINDNFRLVKLNVAPSASESTEKGSKRRVEWAVGTNYVWVSGREATEQYIIKISSGIDSAKLHRTIANIADGGNIMFVNNYERARAVQLMSVMINSAATDDAGSGNGNGNGNGNPSSSTTMGKGDGGGKALGTAGLVVGCVSLAAALGALYVVQTSRSVGTDRNEHDDHGTKSLASKNVA